MWSYFKPLRRKLGVATLMLACLFAMGWMRSRSIYEQYSLHQKRRAIQFISSTEFFGFQAFWLMKPSTKTNLRFSPRGYFRMNSAGRSMGFPHFPSVPHPRHWVIQREIGLGGFRIVTANASWNDIQFLEMRVPYWSIVVPLTLTSAWLLLVKPRTRRPQPASET